MNWEHVETCDFCGGSDFREYLRSHRPNWHDGALLVLDECTNCHLVFANPRPSRVELNRDYLQGTGNAREAVERKLARKNVFAIHRKVIEDAAAHLGRPPRRLYDMGCGAGSLVEESLGMGLETWCNDINRAAIERLSALGAEAFHGFTRDIDLPRGHFDIVTNLDYIEHTYEPNEDLRLCHDILAPGGVIYVKTLFLDCAAHLMNDDGWKLFGMPQPGESHFFYYWPRVLTEMIKAAGFELCDVRIGQLIAIIARKPQT